jgi:hypothetical protein
MEDAMTRKSLRTGAISVIAIAMAMHGAAANAGACAGEVEAFQKALPRDKNGELAFVAAAPQSIAAQLEHQPTRESVERAKRLSRSLVAAVLAQAQALDSQGRPRECRDALAKAKVLIDP